MRNFPALLAGELQRMVKYSIFAAGLVVALLWIGVLHFTDIEDVSGLFVLLLFVDATTMSILYAGVTVFFEKQEGSLKSLLVCPISRLEHVSSKVCGNVVVNLQTVVLLYLYAWYFKEISLSFWALAAAVALVAFFHALVGLVLTYYSETFTDLLMNMMKYAFLLMLPVLLDEIGVIQNALVQNLLYAIPTRASMTILTASGGGIDAPEVWLFAGYLIVGSAGLLWLVLKKFDKFAAKESGV